MGEVKEVHILIVASSVERNRNIANFLNRRGIRTSIVTTLKSAIEYIGSHRPHMVLLSYNLLGGQISKVMGLIQQTFGADIIVFAETTDGRSAAQISALNARHVLHAPVSGPKIQIKVQQILNEKLDAIKKATNQAQPLVKEQAISHASTLLGTPEREMSLGSIIQRGGDSRTGEATAPQARVENVSGEDISAIVQNSAPQDFRATPLDVPGHHPKSMIAPHPRTATQPEPIADEKRNTMGKVTVNQKPTSKGNGVIIQKGASGHTPKVARFGFDSKTPTQGSSVQPDKLDHRFTRVHQDPNPTPTPRVQLGKAEIHSPFAGPTIAERPNRPAKAKRKSNGAIEYPQVYGSNTESLLAKTTLRVLRETAWPSRNPAIPITNPTQLRVMSVTAPRFKGYLVTAMSGNFAANGPFLEIIRNRLHQYLEDKGEASQDEEVEFDLDIEQVDFFPWAEELAQFLAIGQNGDEEIAMAFITGEEAIPIYATSEDANMLSVEITKIPPIKETEFDIFIFLPKNRKYIKYIRSGGHLDQIQLDRLLERNITQMHIRAADKAQFSKFCGKNFIKAKLNSGSSKKSSSGQESA